MLSIKAPLILEVFYELQMSQRHVFVAVSYSEDKNNYKKKNEELTKYHANAAPTHLDSYDKMVSGRYVEDTGVNSYHSYVCFNL